MLLINNLIQLIFIFFCISLVSSELECLEDEKGEAVNLGRRTFEPEDMLQAFPEPGVCGKSNATFSKVVHGRPTKLGAFPWMALLGYKCNGTTFYHCGGTLISTKHVLTAAHCVHGFEDKILQVRLGELDLESDEDGATPLDVNVKAVIKHEDYSKISLKNDIAVLALEEEVTFTDLIKPICLPMENATRMKTFVKFQPLIAGWGRVEYRGAAASHLQVAPVTVKDNSKCDEVYSNRVIDDTVICAGSNGRDACQGDSGGPLMMYLKEGKSRKSHVYQIGVVSFGRRCATGGYPGVYTKVGYFMPWLEQNIISA